MLEDDQANDEVAPHHELGEPGHHVAGCVFSLAAMRQDRARRRHVQREAQNCRDQQHGRKGRKIKRTLDPQRDHQDQGRQRDREGKAQVDQKSGNRQDQYRHYGDDTDRERRRRLPIRRSGARGGISTSVIKTPAMLS